MIPLNDRRILVPSKDVCDELESIVACLIMELIPPRREMVRLPKTDGHYGQSQEKFGLEIRKLEVHTQERIDRSLIPPICWVSLRSKNPPNRQKICDNHSLLHGPLSKVSLGDTSSFQRWLDLYLACECPFCVNVCICDVHVDSVDYKNRSTANRHPLIPGPAVDPSTIILPD